MLNATLTEINAEKTSIEQLRNENKETIKPGVSIIVSTFKKEYINNIFSNYSRLDYPNKELIIVLNNNELDMTDYKSSDNRLSNVRIYKLDEEIPLGNCLNFAIENSKFDYIAKMDDDDYYGPNYLTDLMNVFNYSDVQMTGKNPVFVYFEENNSLYILNHSNLIMGATFLFKKVIFDKVKFRNLSFREDFYFISDCIKSGIKISPSDKYNYVYLRHNNLKNHTFQISAEHFTQNYDMKEILITENYLPIITV